MRDKVSGTVSRYRACSVTVADFDGDGNQDILTSNSYALAISVLLNTCE